MARRKPPAIPDALLDQLLAGADPKSAFDPNGLLDSLKKALAERALNAEMDHHLSGEGGAGNGRNGYSRKTVLTETGKIELDIPRDRQASFDPQLIAKYQRRFPGFDDKIISMYARGMSAREIVGHLRELYGVEVSPDLISAVTDAVLEEVATWQARPLEPVYPLVFFDALRVKIRDEGLVRNKAVHIALGVRADGTKEVLGLWLEQNEGAKFWLRVLNELKNRGVEDILIAVVDGLKGFPDAIQAVFPETTVQTCIVHLLRTSLDFVSWKDRKAVAAALKDIYRAVDADAGAAALAAFEDSAWGRKYPAIGQSWRRAWTEVVPFYAFPGEVRRLLYTTDEIDKFRCDLICRQRFSPVTVVQALASIGSLPGIRDMNAPLRGAVPRSSPAAAQRCAFGAGLDGKPCRATLSSSRRRADLALSSPVASVAVRRHGSPAGAACVGADAALAGRGKRLCPAGRS
ncbi:putative transposase [Azospirillum canadense]|nr:putative transposase [Azospirillum canadense]